jgi:hypothetical protein
MAIAMPPASAGRSAAHARDAVKSMVPSSR